MNILCVCSAGRNRSRHLAKSLADEGHETDFAGVHPLSMNKVTQSRIDWADVVICVMPGIAQALKDNYDVDKRVIMLDVPNRRSEYPRMEREALEALRD